MFRWSINQSRILGGQGEHGKLQQVLVQWHNHTVDFETSSHGSSALDDLTEMNCLLAVLNPCFESKRPVSMMNHLANGRLAEGTHVAYHGDGFQKIGFPLPVGTGNHVQSRGYFRRAILEISKLPDDELFELHDRR